MNLFDSVDRPIRQILQWSLEGKELSVGQALTLAGAQGMELHALCMVADRLRAEQAGDVVTYVVNRNINFTNVCVMSCGFCAFSRAHRSDEAYFLGIDEIV